MSVSEDAISVDEDVFVEQQWTEEIYHSGRERKARLALRHGCEMCSIDP